MWKFIISFSLFILLAPMVLGQELHFEAAFKNGEIPQIPLALLQDSQGFIWVGTTDGAFRYDGREVLEYRHDATDSTSISDNYIKTIYEDRKGNIWMGTKNGLNCYDPLSEKFALYFFEGNDAANGGNYIHDIIEDHKGRIWYGTYEGLFQLNPETKVVIQFKPGLEHAQKLSNKLVWSVFEDNQQRIWAGTHEGFTVFKNDDTYQFKPYFGDLNQESGLATDRIFDIIQQADGTIWLASGNGIFRVIENNESFKFQKFSHQKKNPNSLSNNVVFELLPKSNNKIWAATYNGGLNEIILPDNRDDSLQFTHHRADPKNESSISLDRIESMMIDQSGLMWVGTGVGLDKVSKSLNKFKTLDSSPTNKYSLSNDIIKSIYKDSFGNLWVGTFKGLNFLSAENYKNKNFQFEQFLNDPNVQHSISHNNIFGTYEDSQAYLWICSQYGLNYIHLPSFLKERKFNHFATQEGLSQTHCFNLVEIEKGSYWIATTAGLVKMSFVPEQAEKTTFEIFEMDRAQTGKIVNSYTQDIIKDKFGVFWFGTFDGISKYVEKDGNTFFENYKSDAGKTNQLSNNSFRCFFKDSKERLWIGTRSGLNLVQQDNPDQRATFKVYNNKDGLPNDVIHSIEEAANGNLWISTNKGLVVFNPDYQGEQNPVVKIYTKADGLTSSSFVFRSSFKDDDGQLFFGTANGLNYFDPEHIPTNNYIPTVRFTRLKILNKVVKPQRKKNGILKHSITFSEKITLKHWQNIISLEFAALDFHKPEKNQYQYRLSGLNQDWVDNGTDNFVTFTNLPTGMHTLLVKGSNNDGLWNDTPAQLIIEVLPPFWETWWAYGFYLLVFSGLLIGFIRFRIQQKVNKIKAAAKLEKARQEAREILRKNNAEDFHDELGHRFTKISLFLELAEQQSESNASLKNYLSKIKANAAGLSEGLRDLIWSLDPKKDSMYQTLTRLQEFGDNLFEFSSIHFKTTGIDESINKMELAPDVRKNILMLFKEAMNNCLKYSEAQNAVLKTKIDDQSISLIFQDDGKGFDLYKTKKGYGLKNMQSRAAKVCAGLEINSIAGEGTEVILRLKL